MSFKLESEIFNLKPFLNRFHVLSTQSIVIYDYIHNHTSTLIYSCNIKYVDGLNEFMAKIIKTDILRFEGQDQDYNFKECESLYIATLNNLISMDCELYEVNLGASDVEKILRMNMGEKHFGHFKNYIKNVSQAKKFKNSYDLIFVADDKIFLTTNEPGVAEDDNFCIIPKHPLEI